MTEPDDPRREIWEGYLLAFIEGAVREGALEVDGQPAGDIRRAFVDLLIELGENIESDEGSVRIDFTDSLLGEAVRFREGGLPNFANMFYATWVEHWLNSMILWGMRRRGLGEAEAKRAIRETGIPGKTGHLWSLVWDEPLPSGVVSRIGQLATARNSFVHYKWQLRGLFDPDPSSTRASAVCDGCDALIADLRNIEDRLVFSGRRAELAEMAAEFARAPDVT